MITEYTAPMVSDPQVQKALTDVARQLNALAEQVAKLGLTKAGEPEGTLRVEKTADNEYRVYVKYRGGWLISSSTAFTFRDRSA